MLNGVDEKEEKDNNQNDLKEHGIKMTHHPPGTTVIDLPYLIHEFCE